MTTFTQGLTGRRVVAGGYPPDHDACRVDRVVLVRGTIRTLYDADKRFRVDPRQRLAGRPRRRRRRHLELSANDMSRSLTPPPNTGGDTE